MDIRTACQLCLCDLIPLIEAGDLRNFRIAEDVVATHLEAITDARDQGALLGRLADELAAIEATRPECDALLRGVRACVRRLLQRTFEQRRKR